MDRKVFYFLITIAVVFGALVLDYMDGLKLEELEFFKLAAAVFALPSSIEEGIKITRSRNLGDLNDSRAPIVLGSVFILVMAAYTLSSQLSVFFPRTNDYTIVIPDSNQSLSFSCDSNLGWSAKFFVENTDNKSRLIIVKINNDEIGRSNSSDTQFEFILGDVHIEKILTDGFLDFRVNKDNTEVIFLKLQSSKDFKEVNDIC